VAEFGAVLFAQALAAQPEQTAVRVGVVSSVTPFIVNFRGALLSHLGLPTWYTPVVGHVVTLDRQGQTWMCTGRVISS
jgi:hypothetical protein